MVTGHSYWINNYNDNTIIAITTAANTTTMTITITTNTISATTIITITTTTATTITIINCPCNFYMPSVYFNRINGRIWEMSRSKCNI